MEKDNQIFGIRAIIEAIQAGKEIDKVFLQKDIQGDLMRELMKVMKSHKVNFTYVPVEKLNRLTPKNHQGAVATIAPVNFHDLETLISNVLESGKTITESAAIKFIKYENGKAVYQLQSGKYKFETNL